MSFDVAACTSLRIEIVARTIAQLPEYLQPDVIRDWFTAYDVDAADADLPIELTELLKKSLSNFDIIKPRDRARRIAFTPLIVSVSKPSEMVPDL